MSENISIPIMINADEKGYFDRKCPNQNCTFNFKINVEDWKNKVSDKEVHCPMCGHIDTSDNWMSDKQREQAIEIAKSYAMSLVRNEINKTFKHLERSTRNNKYCKITYKSDRNTTFINNPIGASEEWELDITCDKCGTRYSVIGSAYFCPCCGYNAIEDVFDESMDTIKKMINSIPEMKEMLAKLYGRDKAETMCRSMIEGSLGDIVSVFQKFAELKYKTLSTKKVKVNNFQIVDKGSELFREASSKGYDEWLSNKEIDRMNLLFQRRHLIEHNNGIVDQKYIDKSNDTSYTVDQRIVTKECDIFELLNIIKKLGKGLKELNL